VTLSNSFSEQVMVEDLHFLC